MTALINILFVIDCYKTPYAGTEGQIIKLVQGLDKDKDKYKATFIVFRESEYIRLNDFPIPVEVVNIQRLSSPFSWLRLFGCFLRKKRENYRLAHIFFNDPSMICPLLLKLLGYKIIISRRDMGYWYSWSNVTILKINAFFVDLVITNSEAVKKITMSKEGYISDHVAVIYNGYQESAIVDSIVKNIDVVMDESEIRIALVANIRPIKRIADAIKAINIVHDTDKRVVLYVVGDGDKSQLLELAETLGISLSIRFLGPRDDVLQLLPLFHIGILCSESEGFSNTLIEYMQSGLPVVCSNVGGNPEIVEHGVNGFLYETGDIQILAKYILELIVDDSLRERMGQLGMKKVKKNYSLTNYVDHHQRLYEELLS